MTILLRFYYDFNTILLQFYYNFITSLLQFDLHVPYYYQNVSSIAYMCHIISLIVELHHIIAK